MQGIKFTNRKLLLKDKGILGLQLYLKYKDSLGQGAYMYMRRKGGISCKNQGEFMVGCLN